MGDLERIKAALKDKTREADDLEDVLLRSGFVRCNIAACNCGSWHARYGLPERFQEIEECLANAGHPLCNENGNSVLRALESLVEERDALREAARTVPVEKRAAKWPA